MTQLALALAPPGPFRDEDNPSFGTESNAALLIIIGQERRRLRGRRQALQVIRWRIDNFERVGALRLPTKAQQADARQLGDWLDLHAHLDDLDRLPNPPPLPEEQDPCPHPN